MPTSPPDVLAALHLAVLVPLSAYGLHRVVTLTRLARGRAVLAAAACGPLEPDLAGSSEACPRVLLQVPLYNERTVAAGVLRAVGELRWPRERLEIQVLDDSSDETCEIVDREVRRLRARGCDVRVVRRRQRRGFKAGALEHGLALSEAPFVAIFDADFAPGPDFLQRLMPSLVDPRVGMVQARWGHRNRDESRLTRAQAVLLDGHFAVEHAARFASGLWFNFNGTAGIWRREAVEAAGGWQHDTLTEDLDLSYRAQLLGWRFVYRDDVVAPAELPADIGAFLGQQRRWAKGSVQVLRKLGPRLWGARIPWRLRQEALVHLAANGAYPLVLALAVLMPISALSLSRRGSAFLLALFLLCVAAVALAYWVSQARVGRPWQRRLVDVPLALALGIGMAWQQTRSVLSGLAPQAGEFVRTPKRGERAAAPGNPREARYRAGLPSLPGVELLLALWLGFGIWRALRDGYPGAVPFQALFAAGFLWVGLRALWARVELKRAAGELVPNERRPVPAQSPPRAPEPQPSPSEPSST